MKYIELTANYLSTIDWLGDTIIDWASGGTQYTLDGQIKQSLPYHYGRFDRAIASADGVYSFIYKSLGTKGLLLKNGEIMREINRPYYCAEVYEYPAAFITVGSAAYLIHCPISYNQLDFEEVETGKLVTNIPGRKPADIFHSRLEISPDGTTLLCRSWGWHPVEFIEVFNIADCIKTPQALDIYPVFFPDGAQICTASFIDNENILIGSSDELINEENIVMPQKSVAVWNLKTKEFSKPVKVTEEFGNLFAIDDNIAWDMFKYPKTIDIRTGEILDKVDYVNSGDQRSSILGNLQYHYPQIAFNRQTKSIAIAGKDKINILLPD
ncbi:MAG: hypothetical protein V4592_24390 [Bacteroidota bacterium]